MKPKKSRATTFWGTMAAVSGAVLTFSPEPISKTVAGVLAAISTAMLGVVARDHNVSSEDAGLVNGDVPVITIPPESKTTTQNPNRGPLLLVLVCLTFGPLPFTGCTILSKPQSLENKATAVAWIASSELLKDRPDYRPAFDIAATDLEFLSQAETLSFAEIWAILDSLPVDQLQGRNAALYFGGAMLFFEDEIGTVAVENPEQARAIIRGLAAGLRRTLK